jgi:hypothetical protein
MFIADVEYVFEVVGVEHAVLFSFVRFEYEIAYFLFGNSA